MKSKPFIPCPHCGEPISFVRAVGQKPARSKVDWKSLDWTKSNKQLAADLGMSVWTVLHTRCRLFGVTRKTHDWKRVDWAASNQQIAKTLGTSESYVATQRQRFLSNMSEASNGEAGRLLPGAPGSAKYDHDEVRCDVMADWDCDNLMPGTPRTCCVCAGHDCEEARAERLKHPARNSKG